ncbi:MAG: NADH-quinone oxidoreductase subunit NuoH [Elusimicrobiota bacterium]
MSEPGNQEIKKPSAAKPPARKYPDPVFNEVQGRLLHGTRLWPTELWPDRWALPRYRNGALILAGIVLAGIAAAAIIGELGRIGGPLWAWIEGTADDVGLPPAVAQGVWALLKVALVLGVVAASPILIVWWERKISAHMQSRFGPMYTGGFHGWLQTIADGIKLFLKENITPLVADKWVHRLAPAVVVAPALLAFAPVSFGNDLAAADIDVGVVYVFAMAGVSVVGIMMAGWGSGNKYALLGGLRSVAQLVSYELPRTFSVVPVLMLAGTLNLTRIAEAQHGYWLGFFPKWFIFYPVVGQLAFLIFLIASVAETNRIPFDLPEAESELVAGFHTEYSGMKFALFFMGEYAYVLLSCCLAAAFFLGGGAAPLPVLAFIPSWGWFLAKVVALVFCFLWFRWTFPRFRVDRLMDFNWKFLLPWSFANIAFAGAYMVF